MAIVSPYTYAEAQQLQLPFWDLMLDNWGNLQTGADANSLVYQGLIPGGSAYICIGPRSTVDRANVGFQYLGPIGKVPTTGVMPVDLECPSPPVTGPLTISAGVSTLFSDTYYRDGVAGVSVFGGAQVLMERPTLQLFFFQQPPPISPGILKRDIMLRNTQVAAAAIGAEQLLGIWPVMGRKCVALYFNATDTLVAGVRFAAISGEIAFGNPPIEETIATASVDGTTGARWSASTSHPMAFVAAYYTTTAGAGNINVKMIAQDTPCGSFTGASGV